MGWIGGGVGVKGNKGLVELVVVTMINYIFLNSWLFILLLDIVLI